MQTATDATKVYKDGQNDPDATIKGQKKIIKQLRIENKAITANAIT
jgi:hypothetical protein